MRPPILAEAEWQARQFFCRMGATCPLKEPFGDCPLAGCPLEKATAQAMEQITACVKNSRGCKSILKILISGDRLRLLPTVTEQDTAAHTLDFNIQQNVRWQREILD